ncbi:DUF21-domain-containing protein [Sparassis crispa]|uniref:4-hydroxybenzoate polyprenyltransferase, mitochondrial n=1 Tax=Sparassis crispa TaxID=139825 RepID=A0A401GAZ8_9APHY|nr:DUF21-domain-containing protein [Sparassis crispa]GBE79332.1 DUF21-domain-containing protein [Sparassis crispa]
MASYALETPVTTPLWYISLFGVGAIIMRGAGCTINDMWDRHLDKSVARTKERPLANGAISTSQAVGFLGLQLSAGLAVLTQLNWYSILLGASSLSVVCVYPFMKRVTYWPQAVLGLAFNWGALLGWSAVAGSVNWSVCLPLYAGGICWTLVYDSIYAHQDKTDDVRVGIRSTALLFGENTRPILGALSTSTLSLITFAGYMNDHGPLFYTGTGLAALQLARVLIRTDFDDHSSCWKGFVGCEMLRVVLFLLQAVIAAPVSVISDFVENDPGWSPVFWYKLIVSSGLVLAGGVFAGLTLALMGLDDLHLRVLAASSDDLEERANARKVLSLLSYGRHWVLVVLLLSNVIVNESLPVFLDSALGGGLAAVIISTTTIVIFGIIPQAVCVRYGLSIGAKCAPMVLVMMYLLAPVAYPVARLLDRVLGEAELHTYKKAELKSLLALHRQGKEPLKDDEWRILNGVLELSNKKVEELMTPMADVVAISGDTVLDHQTVNQLLRSGYSRIPVYYPGKPMAFMGLLLVKNLSTYDPSEALPASSFPLSILPEAHPSIDCFRALDYFQIGRAHLLLLSNTPGKEGGALGVLTLEDVIEEILSTEIVDETDRYEDNHSKRRAKRSFDLAVMRGIVEYHLNRGAALSMSALSPTNDITLLGPSRQSSMDWDRATEGKNIGGTTSGVV